MNIARQLQTFALYIAIIPAAFAFTIDGKLAVGNGPFNDSGQTYLDFSELPGRELEGGSFKVVQNGTVLFEGEGPYVFDILPHSSEFPISISPTGRCGSKYGCTKTLYHQDPPAITSHWPRHSADFESTTLIEGGYQFKAVGLYANSYEFIAPDGTVLNGTDFSHVSSFPVHLNQTGDWTFVATGHTFFEDEDTAITKNYTVISDVPLVNLGNEHSLTQITVQDAIELEVSQWSNWSWTPAYVEIGVTSNDGSHLDGVSVIDEAGNTVDLSGWFGRIKQPYTGNARYFTVASTEDRALTVQWWARGH